KLDIEGAELAALRGLEKHIEKVGTILGEIHPDLVNPKEVLQLLNAHGFDVRTRPQGGMLMFQAVRPKHAEGKK
ncbi:MAG: FkbM family methyltransferase, partial [Candidatus Micrarchaeota archaeon]|nr:FkbM family methyltransferase [Candidatus Micrarchaeota archaeon]